MDDTRHTRRDHDTQESKREQTDQIRTDGGKTTSDRSVLTSTALEETYPRYAGQVTYTEHIEQKEAEIVPADSVLRPELASNLDNDLFTHQAEALQSLDNGENVVVTTSTSSGKTWIYTIQAARNVMDDPPRDFI